MTGAATLTVPIPAQRRRGMLAVPMMLMLLRIAMSAGLLTLTFWLSSAAFDWRDLAAIGFGSIAACLLLSAAIVVILGWRWQCILAGTVPAARIPSFADLTAFSWIGLAVNQLVPSVFGGDAMRIGLLARSGVPAVAAAGSVVADRVYGLVGLLVLCVVTAPVLGPVLSYSAFMTSVAAALVVAVVMLFLGMFGRLRDLVARIPATANGSMSWRKAILIVPAAMAVHLANIMVFLIIAHALGADLPILPAVAVLSAVLLVSALPFSIAGWGVRELALVSAFAELGHGDSKIIAVSVAYGLFLLVTQAAGFLMILRGGRR